jgi:hypothetical protein
VKSAIAAAVCGALLSLPVLASDRCGPTDLSARTPQTDAARQSVDLLARAEHAIGGYVAACASGELRTLSDVTTKDARIEYALDEPGAFLAVDVETADCGAILGLSNLWILPTGDASSVFVHYDTPAGHQLALVEMRDERIARIVSYSGAPLVVVTPST